MRFTAKQHREYMKQLPGRASSAALLLENPAGELLIIKSSYKDHWTVPGGVIEQDEMPKTTAIREAYEEVGIEVDPQSVEFVAVAVRTSPDFITYQFIFKTHLLESTSVRLQQSEIDEYAFVSPEQISVNERFYGEVIYTWAHGRTGYIEQAFEAQAE